MFLCHGDDSRHTLWKSYAWLYCGVVQLQVNFCWGKLLSHCKRILSGIIGAVEEVSNRASEGVGDARAVRPLLQKSISWFLLDRLCWLEWQAARYVRDQFVRMGVGGGPGETAQQHLKNQYTQQRVPVPKI